MDKAPDAFRTISEVADELDLPQHVLRFWETRFQQIKPLKRGGGRRYYRPEDVDLVRAIRQLLYGEGYTIRGVQRILKEQGARAVANLAREAQGGAALVPPPLPEDLDDEDAAPAVAPPPAEARPSVARTTLGPEDRARLSAALDDLVECQRILAAARAA